MRIVVRLGEEDRGQISLDYLYLSGSRVRAFDRLFKVVKASVVNEAEGRMAREYELEEVK